MNISCQALGVKSRLFELPKHIAPGMNPNFGPAPGINRSSCYVSGRYSLTDLHLEDNYLDSANVIHRGELGSGKIWLCVDPYDFPDLTQELSKSIRNLRALGKDDVSDYLEGCPTPANHKNLSITTEYLRSRNFSYQMITQRPGDLVYVGPYVYHQVLNLGVCLAEAVNVGCSHWNVGANGFVTCSCPSNALRRVPPNPTVSAVVKDRVVRRHVCPTPGCSYSTTLMPHLHAHLQHEVDPDAERKYACIYCPKLFTQLSHVTRHEEESHGPGGRRKKACEHCGKVGSAGNLARHVKGCPKRPKCPPGSTPRL